MPRKSKMKEASIPSVWVKDPPVEMKEEGMNIKSMLIVLALVVFLGFVIWVALRGFAGKAQAKTEEAKINICHFNSGKNKYEGIEIPESSWDTHQGHGDFLYEGPLDKNGKPENKDKAAEIWCEENKPQPSPTPTPTPVPECPTWTCSECAEYEPKLEASFIRKECPSITEYCQANYECGYDKKDVWSCSCPVEPTPTPTPEPTPEPKKEESKPSGCTGDCSAPAPQCGSPNTTKEPANFHVYRNGDTALLKWWATEGNKVHAYWKLNMSPNWEHSVTAGNSGYLEINGLGNADWTFGLQQVNDCGGGLITAGNIISVVDGNVHRWVLFR